MEVTVMEYAEMKDRIAHIIRAKNLTAAEFALRLGIQPSNISHLLAGRNNPSLEFVKKLKETFTEYNLDWIIFGKGPMTVSEPFVEPFAVVSPREADQPKPLEREPETTSDPSQHDTSTKASALPSVSLPKGVILLFEDDTYKFLSPR
ncbi:MAG: helix-turn-helix transcriptional regulator [Bacteroidales bacterium]|nr:helix-turn-helix transcriptional regulator [Bacteroidales bacterium]